MNRLRRAIDADRHAYQSAAYPGDLGELATASPRAPRRRGVAIGVLALAAALLVAFSAGPSDVAAPESASTAPPQTFEVRRPSLLAQSIRVVKLGDGAERHVRVSFGVIRPLALLNTNPTLPAPIESAPPRRTESRRREPSIRSLTLRSMRDAISLGT